MGRYLCVGAPVTDLRLSGWRYRAVIASAVLAALAYMGFSLWVGFDAVLIAIRRVGLAGVAVMLGLSLLNYLLRFIRWQRYLKAMQYRVPWWSSLSIYLAGFALTTTPGKAGEALRGVLLKDWYMPYTHSLAAFISERLSDLVAIVLLTLFGIGLKPEMDLIIILGGVSVGLCLLLLAIPMPIRWLAKFAQLGDSRWRQIAGHFSKLLSEARACHAPRALLSATLLSLIAWASEAAAFYLMLQWLGRELPITFAVFVYAVAMLAGALSFLPGGLGGAEAVMVGLLLWKNVSLPDATAATLLIRLTTLWFAVVLGIMALSRSRHQQVTA